MLARQEKDQLAAVVPKGAISNSTIVLTEAQHAAVRTTFASAFTLEMKVCAASVGVGLLTALATYQKHRMTMGQKREYQAREEKLRRAEAASARAADSSGSTKLE